MANGFTGTGRVQLVAGDDARVEYLNDFDAALERVISQWDRADRSCRAAWWSCRSATIGGTGQLGGAGQRAARRMAGRLHLQGAERCAARVRQLPVRRREGRRRHPAGRPDGGSLVQRDAFNRVSAQQLVSNVRTKPTRFAEVRGPGYQVLDLFPQEREPRRHPAVPVSCRGVERDEPREFCRTRTPDHNTALGTITAQNGLPRQLQIAARVTF